MDRAEPVPTDEVCLAPKVLVVHEFGIWPYDREAATAFFTLVSARYERGSIILTSNKGFGEWGELLGDTVHWCKPSYFDMDPGYIPTACESFNRNRPFAKQVSNSRLYL